MPRNSITGKVATPYNLALEEMNEERSLISRIQANYDDLNEVVNNCLDLQGTKEMRNNINMNNYNIKKAQEGTEASQLATVSQVRKGKFGVDKSTGEATIDLEESPVSTNEYTDGLIITFKATKNSVNNMTLQINSLGYKELDKEQVGIGSFVKDDIVKVLYNKDTDKFVSLNDKNQTINYYGVVADFNDLIMPIKAMVTINSTTKNMPDSSTLSKYKLNALLEVNKKFYNRNNTINAGNYMCEVQTLAIYGNDKYTIGTWTRQRFKGVWQSWKRDIFQDLGLTKYGTSQFQEFTMVAQKSTDLINKSNGSGITRSLYDDNYFNSKANQSIGHYVHDKRYNARFYSTIVCDDFSGPNGSYFVYNVFDGNRPNTDVFHYVWVSVPDLGPTAHSQVYRYLAWFDKGQYKCIYALGHFNSNDNAKWKDSINVDKNDNIIVPPFKNRFYEPVNGYYVYWGE